MQFAAQVTGHPKTICRFYHQWSVGLGPRRPVMDPVNLDARRKKLSIRMVAGFWEAAETEETSGCGGPIRTEFTIIVYTFS